MATINLTLSSKSDKITHLQEVMMRLTIGSTTRRARTNVFVQSEYWDASTQSISIKELSKKRLLTDEEKQLKADLREKTKRLNEMTDHVSSSVDNADKAAIKKDKDWLKNLVHDYLFPPQPEEDEPQAATLLQAIEDLIESATNGTRTVEKTQKPVDGRTTIQYRQMQRLMISYLKSRRMKDIEIANVDKKFYESFVAYLYKQGYKLNTVGKHIKNLKAAINALPLAQRATCEFIEPKKCRKLAETVDNIYLTEDELNQIASIEITTPYLDKVRDQFLLLAWTGCRYSDLPKLNKSNIYTMSNGGQCFKLEQKKTNTKVVIPILPPAQAILEKYDYEVPEPMSNQPFNRFLKEVAKLAGLEEEVSITRTESNNGNVERVEQRFSKWECVTAHTARRSFATNMYKRDYPTLMIMKITGHKTEKAFLTYIRVTEEENAERMLESFK